MTMHGIDRDVDRFRQIIRGKIKENLKEYLNNVSSVAIWRRPTRSHDMQHIHAI